VSQNSNSVLPVLNRVRDREVLNVKRDTQNLVAKS